MRFLYTISILLYGLGIRLASVFNRKAARWVHGRRELFHRLKAFRHEDTAPLLWFHCASLGEFEQGRPLIEKVKMTFPDHRILLTFFSPSGYEVRKNDPLADHVTFLPLDTPRNARRFIRLARPRMVFFIKYEYWYNFLHAFRRNHIPVFIVSAIFRPKQFFFAWYGLWFRNQLRHIEQIFVQNESSLGLLGKWGLENAQLSGDTRFDRVAAIAGKPESIPYIGPWTAGRRVVIAGSTWPEDEALLLPFIETAPLNLVFIIAPHEVHRERIRKLVDGIKKPVAVYSALKSPPESDTVVMVIDTMGMLSRLYRYATIVYIGGGFGKGIHNILEGAAFGKPVVMGPNHDRFQEATDLIRLGGARSISSAEELRTVVLSLLEDRAAYDAAATAAGDYVHSRKGATDRIIDTIRHFSIQNNTRP